jgi:hypothetical protein
MLNNRLISSESKGAFPMGRLWLYVTQFVLLMIMIITLVGCAVSITSSTNHSLPSSTLNASSTYPADISGRVTIPEFLHMKNCSDTRAGANQVFWVVDISIKNKAYERVVTSDYEDWHISAGGEVYHQWEGRTEILHLRDKFTVDDMNVPTGQTGQTTICFSVPDTLKISDAKLCYQGQEPYSYGKLDGGEKVSLYYLDPQTAAEKELGIGQYAQYFVKKDQTGSHKEKISGLTVEVPEYEDTFMQLRTISTANKNNTQVAVHRNQDGKPNGFYWIYSVSIPKAPWVINWSYSQKESGTLERIYALGSFSISTNARNIEQRDGISNSCIIGFEPGDYTIEVLVIGYGIPLDVISWQVKIGVE